MKKCPVSLATGKFILLLKGTVSSKLEWLLSTLPTLKSIASVNKGTGFAHVWKSLKITFICLFIYLYRLGVDVYVGTTCHSSHVDVRGELGGAISLSSLLSPCGSEVQTQVFRLCRKYFICSLASPFETFTLPFKVTVHNKEFGDGILLYHCAVALFFYFLHHWWFHVTSIYVYTYMSTYWEFYPNSTY